MIDNYPTQILTDKEKYKLKESTEDFLFLLELSIYFTIIGFTIIFLILILGNII